MKPIKVNYKTTSVIFRTIESKQGNITEIWDSIFPSKVYLTKRHIRTQLNE